MAKAKAAKDGRVPVEKLILAESKRKRKQPEEDKENSPSKVAVPPPVDSASPASQHGSEDSGELELPEKIAKPKKVLNFRNHFPAGARSCRPICNYSEDDDEDSIVIKDREIELVMQKNAIFYEQRTGDDDNPGEDSLSGAKQGRAPIEKIPAESRSKKRKSPIIIIFLIQENVEKRRSDRQSAN